jgi:diguanylate cyclase (GGDEF)-like protein
MARRQPIGEGDGGGMFPVNDYFSGGFVDEAKLLALLPHPVFVVDVEGNDSFQFSYVNDAYRNLLGDDSATGDLRSVVPAHALVAHVRAFARAVAEQREIAFEAPWGLSTSGRRIAVDVTPIIGDDGECRQLIGAAYEVTEHRRIEAQLAHRTRHDPLTELPNRVSLVEWLDDALARCTPERLVGLVLLDIDHFKVVNDSLGHGAGDQLLMTAAQRVARVLRAGDHLARMGGDELAVVCHDARRAEDVVALAQRVRAVFDEPFSIDDGHEVYMTASLGVAVSDTRDTPERLMRDADVAMFAAKELGRGRVELFDDTMRERAVKRLEIESALRRALVSAEFRVHYQPVVDFSRSEVMGFEALVRWEHPERGLIAPDEFLAVAEETGLIVPIGAWVLQEACAQAARWRAESDDDEPPLTIAVNISSAQIAHPDLVATVDAALVATNLDPSLLVLDINEAVLMEHGQYAVDVLTQLGARGVRVGIDDFGTGQSSLGYLGQLPIHTLKIDQSFVAALGKDPEDAALVSAIVQLGHALGLVVTAEGVEDGAQLHALRSLGCDLGQGYYFARPQPGEVIRALVHHRFRWSQRASA